MFWSLFKLLASVAGFMRRLVPFLMKTQSASTTDGSSLNRIEVVHLNGGIYDEHDAKDIKEALNDLGVDIGDSLE
jgi:hypothetical protein